MGHEVVDDDEDDFTEVITSEHPDYDACMDRLIRFEEGRDD